MKTKDMLAVQLEKLAQECGYDEESESSVDALIAYKDALEEFLYLLADQGAVVPSSTLDTN